MHHRLNAVSRSAGKAEMLEEVHGQSGKVAAVVLLVHGVGQRMANVDFGNDTMVHRRHVNSMMLETLGEWALLSYSCSERETITRCDDLRTPAQLSRLLWIKLWPLPVLQARTP